MPYDSSTGSSGPAHQACEYGLPIVCADIPDFHCMAVDDDMMISFYKLGDAPDLADKLISVLQSPGLQRQMSLHNYEAGVQMTMAAVARTYLRWFELHRSKRKMDRKTVLARLRRRVPAWSPRLRTFLHDWKRNPDFLQKGTDRQSFDSARAGGSLAKSASLRQLRAGADEAQGDWYDANPDLEKAG